MKEQIEEMARAICGLNTSDGCFCDGGYCNYNCLSYEKAEGLYNAGYRKQSEWISVDDRLPKTYESVLVYMPGETPNPTVHEGFLNRFGRWCAGGFDRFPDEVVMWMPLPEPPEMKGSE